MPRLASSAEEAAEEKFGPLLASRGLSPTGIASLDLERVKEALGWIDQVLEQPEPFGRAHYVELDPAGVERLGEVDIRYALHPRRSLLLTRWRDLNIEEVRLQLADVSQPLEPARVEAALQRVQNVVVEAQDGKNEAQSRLEQLDLEQARAQIRRDDKEHQSRLRRAWWSRESVAGTVGAGLLGVFGLSIAVGMWLHTDPPQLMGNAFLLVLGYFFGQGAGQRAERKRDDTDR